MIEQLDPKVKSICELLYDKKAKDIVAIAVGEKTIVADWFVVCSGSVPAQVKTLCDELEEKAGELGLEILRKEGYSAGRWIVLDMGNILVHIFQEKEREYYDMERLWKGDDNVVWYSKEIETE